MMRSLDKSLFIVLCVAATFGVIGCEDHYINDLPLEDTSAFSFDTSGLVNPDTVSLDTADAIDGTNFDGTDFDGSDFDGSDFDGSDFDGSDGDVTCTPTLTCERLGAECGELVNDCGEVVSCGRCALGSACDGMRARCVPVNGPRCGDGALDPGEACDDGPGNSNTQPNACRVNCDTPRCGDRVIDFGEDCDDGNAINTDSCSNRCGFALHCSPCMTSDACGAKNACFNGACAVSCDVTDPSSCPSSYRCEVTSFDTLCLPRSGECSTTNLCDTVTCNNPPPPRCEGDDTLTQPLSVGRCDPASGACSYDTRAVSCADQGLICRGGACVPEVSSCVVTSVELNLGDALGNGVAQGFTFGAGNDHGRNSSCDAIDNAPDVAYYWTTPTDGCFDFNTFGSDFDTILRVKSCSTGDEMMCNDDIIGIGSGLQSDILFDSPRGQEYVIVVDGFGDNAGSYVLNINPCEVCDDRFDNDGDGLTDCDDFDCQRDPRCFMFGEVCDDFIDNDGDGLTDCQDFDCQGDPRCFMFGEVCDDFIDNDGDGLTDCQDFDCAQDPRCFMFGEVCDDSFDNDGDGLIDCQDPDCVGNPRCSTVETRCGDGFDNDGDGLIDCQDPDCAGSPRCSTVETRCGDGLDNDGDGLTDCQDPDCAGNPRCSTVETRCGDGFDNDGDGLTDCEDFDCAQDPRCFIFEEVCGDFIDNDGNGLTDCEDPVCTFDPGCMMGNEVCNDRADNDGDRVLDCADPECYPERACDGSTPFFGGSAPRTAIPDADPVGIKDSLTFRTGCIIGAISVDVDMTHTWIGDLTVNLVSPSGVSVRLHSNTGDSNDNIIGNYPNTLQPATSLQPLLNLPADGLWTLEVSDTFGLDLGTLNAWGLNITCR
jgi:cysteine-rich repeat protein